MTRTVMPDRGYVVEHAVDQIKYFKLLGPVPNCLSFRGDGADARWPGLSDKEQFRYVAKQNAGDNMEIGVGVYHHADNRVERISSEWNSDGIDTNMTFPASGGELLVMVVPDKREHKPTHPKDMLP